MLAREEGRSVAAMGKKWSERGEGRRLSCRTTEGKKRRKFRATADQLRVPRPSSQRCHGLNRTRKGEETAESDAEREREGLGRRKLKKKKQEGKNRLSQSMKDLSTHSGPENRYYWEGFVMNRAKEEKAKKAAVKALCNSGKDMLTIELMTDPEKGDEERPDGRNKNRRHLPCRQPSMARGAKCAT